VKELKRSKLTLVVDPAVVRRAKSFASAHETSVSALVESYLKNLTVDDPAPMTSDPQSWPETTRSLFGTLKGIDPDTESLRRDRLAAKYLHD
jgi:hypothetical protein